MSSKIRCRTCGFPISDTLDEVKMTDMEDMIKPTPTSSGLKESEHSIENQKFLHGPKREFTIQTTPDKLELEMVFFHGPATISATTALMMDGTVQVPSVPNFDQYAGQNLYCPRCQAHVGWSYEHQDILTCMKEQRNEKEDKRKTVGTFPTSSDLTMNLNDKSDLENGGDSEDLSKSVISLIESKSSIIDKALMGKCIIYVAGWWTYRFCYKKKIEQYHEDQDKIKTDNWSMGEFTTSYWGSTDQLIHHVHDKNGQPCEENKVKRNSDISFLCCEKSRKSKDDTSGPKIHAFEETSICSYKIQICIPELCTDHPSSSIDNTIATKLKARLTDSSIPTARQECEIKFKNKEQTMSAHSRSSFVGLIWPYVILDQSKSLDWVRSLKTKTEIN